MNVVSIRADLRTLAGRLHELFCVAPPGIRCPYPLRSSRMKVTPPEVPTPGIAGGGKRKAFASGNLGEPLVDVLENRR